MASIPRKREEMFDGNRLSLHGEVARVKGGSNVDGWWCICSEKGSDSEFAGWVFYYYCLRGGIEEIVEKK